MKKFIAFCLSLAVSLSIACIPHREDSVDFVSAHILHLVRPKMPTIDKWTYSIQLHLNPNILWHLNFYQDWGDGGEWESYLGETTAYGDECVTTDSSNPLYTGTNHLAGSMYSLDVFIYDPEDPHNFGWFISKVATHP